MTALPGLTAHRASLVRFAVVPLTVGVTALLPVVNAAVLVFATAGALIALAAPAMAGALPLILVELIAWIAERDQGIGGRTIAFAVGLYLVHATTALAAGVPWRAHVHVEVLRTWLARCVPAVAGCGAVAAVVALVPGSAESVGFDVLAFGGVVLVACALTWLGLRR